MSFDFQNSAASAARNSFSPVRSTTRQVSDRIAVPVPDRMSLLRTASSVARSQVDQLLILAKRGLPRMMHKAGAFGHTLRAVKVGSQWTERLEGDSLRYQAIVALGLACTDEATQRQVLAFGTAADLARAAAARAEMSDDPGAVALAAWAGAEAGHFHAAPLFHKLAERLTSDAPIPTVDCAWALTAALAGRKYGETSQVTVLARKRLFAGRASSGLFPHILPPSAAGRLRAHIGCFADQVYPIQALARLHAAHDDTAALSMADACAERICALQGRNGQWWWHYDTRGGGVAEGYPVYSVHQHAMAPMALLDLMEAGGGNHMQPIVKGLEWLENHPEAASASLVQPDKGVVWRKVARREPNKAVRGMAAIAAAISPGLRVPAVDLLFPPTRVDYECRPYELGWLLYAWLSSGVVAKIAAGNRGESANVSEEV